MDHTDTFALIYSVVIVLFLFCAIKIMTMMTMMTYVNYEAKLHQIDLVSLQSHTSGDVAEIPVTSHRPVYRRAWPVAGVKFRVIDQSPQDKTL